MLVVGAVFIMIFVAMIIVRILVITIDVLAVFRVAVLGADGSPLPGYSLEDSTIPVDSKRLYSMARWKTKPDLGELLGREVWLHFEIRGAGLYSYRFYPRLA